MYSSSSTEYQKFSDTIASQPPEFNTPTGIPVSSTGQQYYSDNKAEPRPPLPPKPQTPWSTGLCDCFSDVPNCCLTFWCPCITFGRIAEIVDKGSSFWKKLIGFIFGRPSSRAPHRHILRGGFSPSYNATPNPKRKQTKEKSVICYINTACGQNGALYTLIACVMGCPCCYSCFYRSKMRQQYSLHESPCGDCLTHCCCESCALCQEYRELKNRGFDMTIGWHGNVERQNRGIAMAPVVEGGMSR